jgi:hypothetical protein
MGELLVRNLRNLYEKERMRSGYFVLRETKKRKNRKFRKKRYDLY